MDSESADDSGETAHDAAGRVVDDKTAEARERIDRIEKSAGANSPEVQEVERSLADLKAASSGLKERIIDEKKRNEMPIDSALGNPEIERQNADGRNDLPDTDDD
jgi:hypothetical protein